MKKLLAFISALTILAAAGCSAQPAETTAATTAQTTAAETTTTAEATTATEQNAVGNFFMLIGQTLSTNSSFNFNVDWNNATNGTSVNKIDEKELLNKVKDIFNNSINNIK